MRYLPKKLFVQGFLLLGLGLLTQGNAYAEEITQATDPKKGCELVFCPSENIGMALHLPNPLDCGSFCRCDWGKAYYKVCPEELHFNSKLQVCDWPENAGCETKTGSNGELLTICQNQPQPKN